MGGLTEATIKKLKVNELKAELSKRGLAVKGKKDDLVRRLVEALEEDVEDEAEVDPSDEDEEESMEDDGQDSAVGTSQEDMNESETESSQARDEETADDPEVEQSSNVEESKVPDSSCDVETKEGAICGDYVVVTKPADDVAEEVEKGAEAQDAVVEEQEVTEGTGESQDTPMEVAQGTVGDEQVTEGTGESQETAMEGPVSPADISQSSKDSSPKKTPKKSPKKSPKKDVVSSSEKEVEGKSGKEKDVKESPRKSRSERDSKDKDKTSDDSKNGEKERDAKKDLEKDAKKDQEKDAKKDQEKDAKKDPEKDVKKDAEKEVKKEPEIPDVLSVVEDEEGEVPEEFETPEGQVLLDSYISDINFIITNKGTTGHSLAKNGFTFMWAGARANKGAKGGKIGYELKVISLTPTDLPTTEAPTNAVRIGWSSEYSSLQLGETSLSYGFESTGKVCASSSFFEYGEKFTEGDVIGTYLDLESEPKTLRYTKNGEDLGVAMSLTVNLEEKPLFPHIFLRNMKVELNFGGNEEPWFPTLEGYALLQNAGAENIADRTSEAPAEFQECEVYLMVGLPSAGKTSWAKKYADSHPKKHFNVFGVKQVMDRCKLEGRHRKKSDPNAEKLNKAVITILTKIYQLCPKRKRNFIFDQSNVYKIAQETKMTAFTGFKRKAILVVPTHESLRKRTSESKRRGDNIVDIPFGDLCDMKCEFHLPEVGDFFEEIVYPELDEKNAAKNIRDYHSDGSRSKRTGRDDQHAGSKRKRYDEQRSSYDRQRDNRFSGSGGRHDGWKGSGSGYGGYDKGRSHYQPSYGGSVGGYKPNNKPSYDPYRRNSGGSSGGYRQQSTYGGGNAGGYRGATNYNTSSYGGSNNYGNQQSWNNQYQNQNTQNQQWGSANWSNYNNSSSYNSNSGNYRGGGGGYSY